LKEANVNIEIRAIPSYKLDITETLVDSLMLCCSMHYSPECIVAGKVGGFIFGWNNAIKAGNQCDFDPCITATSRQLDIALKIMENPPLMPTERLHELLRFGQLIRHAFSASAERLGSITITVTVA
jgi:hypothetical protein